jgi:hypothetical protein
VLFLYYYYFRQIYNSKERFESLMNLSLFWKSMYEICKLLLTLTLINHIFGCFWIMIARAGINSGLVYLILVTIRIVGF